MLGYVRLNLVQGNLYHWYISPHKQGLGIKNSQIQTNNKLTIEIIKNIQREDNLFIISSKNIVHYQSHPAHTASCNVIRIFLMLKKSWTKVYVNQCRAYFSILSIFRNWPRNPHSGVRRVIKTKPGHIRSMANQNQRSSQVYGEF